MHARIREGARRMSDLADRSFQDRLYRHLLRARAAPCDFARSGRLAMRSCGIQRFARARVVLIAGAIGTALVTSVSPATARPLAPAAPPTTCANRQLLHGSYGDVTVTPGHWCAIGFSTVSGNVDVTGASSFFMYASRVNGNVTITGTTSHPNAAIAPGFGPASAICADAIYGNLTITGSGPNAPWNISGTNYPPVLSTSNCLSQIFVLGNVTFDNNAGAPNEIGGADIEGNLECLGNGKFTTGIVLPYFKSGVNGTTTGQCAGFAVKGDNSNIFPGPPPWLTVDPAG